MSSPIQLLQIPVDGFRLLPLLEDDYPDLVPHPCAVVLHKAFHAADATVIHPASYLLIQPYERHADRPCRCPLPTKDRVLSYS